MRRLLALSASLLMLVSACADTTDVPLDTVDVGGVAPSLTTTVLESPVDDTATTAVTEASGFPLIMRDSVGEIAIESRPNAIVSLSPASTEILFAVGAGDQVLAVDSLSNYPVEAPTDLELSAWTPNVESIIGMGPDLVVISGDTGDLIAGLGAAGIPVLTHFAASNLADVYTQIEQIGAATGHVGEAAALIAQMEADITEIVAEVPEYLVAPTYYHELDDTLYTVTSQTFIGQMYALLGLVNVADPADDGSAYGYPQLSGEYLLEADPDFIFLADIKCCAVTVASLGERAGWDTLSAVQSGQVVELDDDIASRWGPRVVDLLRAVAAAMAHAEVANS